MGKCRKVWNVWESVWEVRCQGWCQPRILNTPFSCLLPTPFAVGWRGGLRPRTASNLRVVYNLAGWQLITHTFQPLFMSSSCFLLCGPVPSASAGGCL